MIRIKISAVMGEKRINQAELAKATGIRANTINELYHDVNDRVSLDQLDLICEALGCELSDIVEYVPNRVPRAERCQGHCIRKPPR